MRKPLGCCRGPRPALCLECWQEEAWGRHRKTLVAESIGRKEGAEPFHSSPGGKEMAFLLAWPRLPTPGEGTDSCCVLLMPCLGQAEPEQSDVPTAGLALPILQLLSCWPCLGPGLCTQPEKLGWAAVFKIKWFSFHSHQRGYKRERGWCFSYYLCNSPPFPRPEGESQRGLCSL